MTWKTIFQIHQKPEKEEKEKQVLGKLQQVSQFPLFLIFKETKKPDDMYLWRIFDNINTSTRKPNTYFLINPNLIKRHYDLENRFSNLPNTRN
jgi:hypothetical protein